jgi:hypothetical protein
VDASVSSAPRPARLPGLRRFLLAALLAAVAIVPAVDPPASTAATVSAQTADSFIESMGVNTHTYYNDTVYYSRFATIEQRLQELGIHHIRENLEADRPDQLQRLNQLAAAGIHSTLILGSPEEGSANLGELISLVGSSLRGSVDAVEGPNEYDLRGGPSWMSRLAPYQEQLYAAIKSNPATSGLPVIGPSLGNTNSQGSDISGSLDYGNIHSYPNGEPPEDNVSRMLSMASEMSGSKPVLATETGYHTALNYSGDHQPTSEAAEAVYMPRLYLDYFANGIVRTFPYELVDEFPDPSHSEAESDFGLLRNDLSPKPAFTALQNLTSILADPGPAFTPGHLDYTISGDQSELNQVLLQKRDGSYYLALWRSESVWNPKSRTPESAASATVQIAFNQTLEEAQEYVPNASSQPLRTLDTSGSSVSLKVGPEVVIVRIGGAGEPLGRIKVWVSKTAVQAGGSVAVKGKLPSAVAGTPTAVTIQRWDGNRWHTIARSHTSGSGFFKKTLRLTASPHSGASRLRAIAREAKPSHPVKVRVLGDSRAPLLAVGPGHSL